MHSQQNTTFQNKNKSHFKKLFLEMEPLIVDDEKLKKLTDTMKEKFNMPETDIKVISNSISVFSQFLAHDITFDIRGSFTGANNIGQLQNDRVINLDLNCVYGLKNFLCDAKDNAKLLLGKGYWRM